MAKYSAQDRRDLAKKGQALPDGSFPIADVEDLKSAIRNWALGKHPQTAKQFIMKRAHSLGAVDVIPDKWKNAQHSDPADIFLAHYGITR
jgi:hypothetical protein